ncbi:MAG: AraC family transcriptional regulator [Chloroflexota bacterium]|nr:AraC family transcriptional regulator [Chloroflexota bacterium]
MKQDVAHLWHTPMLDNLALYRARIVRHSFKRHSHETYVIGMVEQGVQRFLCESTNFITPPRGLIIINPGEVHTGEAAIPSGFFYRAIYPTIEDFQTVAAEVADFGGAASTRAIPWFHQRVIDHPALFSAWEQLHRDLETPHVSPLEIQSRYRLLLAGLISSYAEMPTPDALLRRRANHSIQRVCEYMQAHYAQDITLRELAAVVHWTPYYLIRIFKAETGLPPHAYLEGIRVQHAQRLIRQGRALADVAYATGFSSQSHMTTTFRRIMGVTPGAYARALQS